ncbi:Protein timeless [Gryllus bimaculatus]|nr:Protein timeless [Gryllus bimaculatus]
MEYVFLLDEELLAGVEENVNREFVAPLLDHGMVGSQSPSRPWNVCLCGSSAILGEVLDKLRLEDRNLWTFRRTLGFSQVIKKVMLNTDVGRHTTVELNKLLISGKEAFVDARSTRALVNHMKRVLEKGEKLSEEECESINNCLLLLRNVLHIPETKNNQSTCSLQNQILWNLFSQSIDKILIHLMTCAQKAYWGVTMVQLIAIMYKDQHVGTLQKLLNVWFEASLSESSEDNESNTSPPDQGSGGESSPMLTSDPTSDSSDNGYSQQETRLQNHSNSKMEMDCKNSDSDRTSGIYHSKLSSHSDSSKGSSKSSGDSGRKVQQNLNTSRKICAKSKKDRSGEGEIQADIKLPTSHGHNLSRTCKTDASSNVKCPSSSELSDYGYATQVENQESISTSSNEDECPHAKRPVHQKPHSSQKMRAINKINTNQKDVVQDKKELRRKKLVKRSRTNIMNMKALLHHVPSDEDISNLLKEFTVDFLLKGYGCLVQELHSQLLNPKQIIQVDTSHFFWLVTYFLKFATQLELELEHISPVLSFEIISYLTYEGVNLCEQLEVATRHPGSDLKPFLRRMHLVVTAIREFIQAVETYRKISHLMQIGSTDDLKCLFVLLLHQFNPNLQSRQYLKDLIITNHMLLLLLENVGKLPGYRGNIDIMEHIKQFASVEVMHQYGLLLEDFQNNGEFTNDCVFTMMHHIGGDLEQVASLFQPNILKTFSKIWETDYEVCDDWSDLIEYVIHKFIDKPLQYAAAQPLQFSPMLCDALEPVPCLSDSNSLRWSKEELENLHWFYAQSAKVPDPVGRVRDLYLENGITNKTRIGIIHQLFSQNIVNRDQYEEMTKKEMMNPIESQNEATLIFGDTKISNAVLTTVINRENGLHEVDISNRSIDHVAVLRDQMLREKKGKVLMWLQKFLIEACYVKLNMDKLLSPPKKLITMEPVPHHYTLMNQSIPVVPWNSDQKKSLLYQPFMLLLHKLGFHLPADSGKVYVRIPNFWTPDVLFNIAQKLGPISRASLKFDEKLVKKNFMANNDSSPVLSCHVNGNQFAVQQITHSSPVIRPNSTSNWLQIVMQSKVSASSLPQRPITPPSQSVPVDFPPKTEADQMCSERGSDCSVCETAEGSVASDLTRMCVSDEEERQELQILSDTTIT